MTFINARPVPQAKYGTGISCRTVSRKDGVKSFVLTMTVGFQEENFGYSIAGKPVKVEIGRGTDSGLLKVLVVEKADADLVAAKSTKASARIKCRTCPNAMTKTRGVGCGAVWPTLNITAAIKYRCRHASGSNTTSLEMSFTHGAMRDTDANPPENCDPSNLKAWCQRCHNTYDAPMRSAGIQQRAHAKRAIKDMFPE